MRGQLAGWRPDFCRAALIDLPCFKTVDSIAASAGIGASVSFKDPDGNTIAVFQPE